MGSKNRIIDDNESKDERYSDSKYNYSEHICNIFWLYVWGVLNGYMI